MTIGLNRPIPSERFPNADAFYVDGWEEALKKIPVNETSYLFIATRGHQFDLLYLRFAMQSSAKYIGMLGSLKKMKSLFELLEKEGLDSSNLERVSVPVGIDIGAETPEEIAVSVIAEIIAARKNRNVRLLKDSLHRAASAS